MYVPLIYHLPLFSSRRGTFQFYTVSSQLDCKFLEGKNSVLLPYKFPHRAAHILRDHHIKELLIDWNLKSTQEWLPCPISFCYFPDAFPATFPNTILFYSPCHLVLPLLHPELFLGPQMSHMVPHLFVFIMLVHPSVFFFCPSLFFSWITSIHS